MMERGSVRQGLVHPGWRAWTVALAMAVVGAAAAEVFCHEEHASDQHCAVCLPHQPADKPSGSSQIGFADTAEPLEQAVDREWSAADHARRLPARGPPA